MSRERIEWIDTTKAIGMLLVFYGHYVEYFFQMDAENEIAIAQYKFIYSFHMPLFFILSGFFAKKKFKTLREFKKLFYLRIVPVFTFAIIMIPLWLVAYKFTKGSFSLGDIYYRSLHYLAGHPQLNMITWFLVCLFTAELMNGILGLASFPKRINLITGLSLITIGYFVIENYDYLAFYTRLAINFWYIHEGIIALGFYLVGSWLFPILTSLRRKNYWSFFLFVPLTLLLFAITNSYIENDTTVKMVASEHGKFLPFITESFIGSLLVISLGNIIPANRITNFMGSNTIILIGLNGIFFYFINPVIAETTNLNDSWWFITLNSTLVSFLSMALCYPIIIILNKYIPQLLGKPFVDGPLFKSLDAYSLENVFRKRWE